MDKPVSEAFQKLTFNLNGSIDVIDSYGDDFKLNIPTFGYTYQVELYEDVSLNTVAYRFPFKVGSKNYEVWLYFYFNVLGNKVKFSIKGNLPKASKFNIPFSSSKTAFFKGSSIFFGKLNESTGVDFEHALGLDWSDISSVCQLNTGSKILSINLGTTVNLDPYLVMSPVSGSSAVDRPYQRKTFYAAGRHWVFFSDTSLINYFSSTDGSTWTGSKTANSISSGEKFSVFFDGTYVHLAFCSGDGGAPIYYRRGTPNSNGTITWSAAEQTALPYYSDDQNRDGVSAGSNIWVFYLTTCISPNIRLLDETGTPGGEFWYTTVAVTGSATALNLIYVISPYKTTSSTVGTVEPAAMTNNGWMFGTTSGQRPLWCPDGLFTVSLQSRTGSTGTIWTGSIAARVLKSTGSQMTNPVAMSSWTAATISGGAQNVTTPIYITMYSGGATALTGSALSFDNEYLYLELYLKFTWTGSVSSSARFACQSGVSTFTVPAPNNYYPTICADSSGTPWIAFTRRTAASNSNKYPYIIQAPASDGTWVFTSSKINRWWNSNADLGLTPEYQPCVIPLNSGRVLFNFVRHVTAGSVKSTLYSKHYTGSWDVRLWSSSAFRSTSNAASEAYCITNVGDNALCCNLSGSQGLEHNSWTSGSGWTRSGSIVADTTVSPTSYPVISASGSDYYCFWSSGANIYYKLYTAGAWGSAVTQETEASAVDGTTLTGFYKGYSNINGLAYITGSGTTSVLKYTFLGAAAAAAAYIFPMPIQIM